MKTALGALTVVICFFLLGRKATEKERISLKQLEWMIKLIEHIKICVSASLLPLPDIFSSFRCDEKEMTEFMNILKAEGFGKAAEMLDMPLSAQGCIYDLASTLGRLDGEAQCEKLEQALDRLTQIRDEHGKETERKSKSVQALFSLAGALAAILMF